MEGAAIPGCRAERRQSASLLHRESRAQVGIENEEPRLVYRGVAHQDAATGMRESPHRAEDRWGLSRSWVR